MTRYNGVRINISMLFIVRLFSAKIEHSAQHQIGSFARAFLFLSFFFVATLSDRLSSRKRLKKTLDMTCGLAQIFQFRRQTKIVFLSILLWNRKVCER